MSTQEPASAASVNSVAEAAERAHLALRRAVVDVAVSLVRAGCCLIPGTLISRPGSVRTPSWSPRSAAGTTSGLMIWRWSASTGP
jgi:hypothetical protein